MDQYDDNYGDGGSDDEGLMGALRKIGESGVRGATIDPLRASTATLGAELGEDILEIRLRAKAAASEASATAAAATSAETQARYEELRRKHQVDLNNEKHLDDLEDRGLMEHMRRAREHFRANAEQEALLPSREDLQRGDTEGRRALSSLMTKLKEQQMALQCACDEVHAHATNAGRLARNEQPHGYPSVGKPPSEAAAKCLAHLEKKVMAAVGDLTGIIAALEVFERDLTLARRSYEGVVDGLRRRGEHFEAAYKAEEAAEKGGDE